MTSKKTAIGKIEYSHLTPAEIKILRDSIFKTKQPFVINDDKIPNRKHYLEFPDGRIQLVRLPEGAKDFIVEKELNPYEVWDLKKRNGLQGI